MYDPSVGRWLKEDPIGFDAGDMDLYRYVGNNPINNMDPSGLEVQKKEKQPEWIPYMKGIEIQSGFKGVGEFRDALGNKIIIYRGRDGTIYGSLEPGTKNPEGKDLVAPDLGKCKYPAGTNVWIIWTNEKGQVTKIVWVNLSPTIPGDPRLGVRPGVIDKARDDLQKRLNKIIDDNRNDPDKALKEIQDLAKDRKIVDPRQQSIQTAWEGPFKSYKTRKK